MKKNWRLFMRIAVGALVAVWFMTIAHQVTYHLDNEMCGHGDEGGAQSECVCICACHAAIAPAFNQDVSAPEPILFVTSDYVTLLGTYVPAEIFRPPLANS
jgi:hypothetical protein